MQMKRILCLTLLCLSGLYAMTSHAATYTPDNLPVTYLQDKSRHVVNPDGILSAGTVARMDSLLARIETQKGIQSIVAVVERIEGGDCYDFAMTLGNRLGVGNKQNTGLIILLATQDRCYYILTGEGLEGTLPDAICRRIENRMMVPYLKKGDWNTAMRQTVEAVCGIIDGDDSLISPSGDEEYTDEGYFVAAFIAMFLFFMLLSWLIGRKRNRCPRCGKSPMTRIGTKIRTNRLNGIEHHDETFRCPHCGHTVHRTHDEPWDNGTGFGGFPPVIGPFRGGFGGGGGFSGGSFGGGSFGGGGAGGRF